MDLHQPTRDGTPKPPALKKMRSNAAPTQVLGHKVRLDADQKGVRGLERRKGGGVDPRGKPREGGMCASGVAGHAGASFTSGRRGSALTHTGPRA